MVKSPAFEVEETEVHCIYIIGHNSQVIGERTGIETWFSGPLNKPPYLCHSRDSLESW